MYRGLGALKCTPPLLWDVPPHMLLAPGHHPLHIPRTVLVICIIQAGLLKLGVRVDIKSTVSHLLRVKLIQLTSRVEPGVAQRSKRLDSGYLFLCLHVYSTSLSPDLMLSKSLIELGLCQEEDLSLHPLGIWQQLQVSGTKYPHQHLPNK